MNCEVWERGTVPQFIPQTYPKSYPKHGCTAFHLILRKFGKLLIFKGFREKKAPLFFLIFCKLNNSNPRWVTMSKALKLNGFKAFLRPFLGSIPLAIPQTGFYTPCDPLQGDQGGGQSGAPCGGVCGRIRKSEIRDGLDKGFHAVL